MDFRPVSFSALSTQITPPALRFGAQRERSASGLSAPMDTVRFGASDASFDKSPLPAENDVMSSREIAGRLNPLTFSGPWESARTQQQMQRYMHDIKAPMDFEAFHSGIPALLYGVANQLASQRKSGDSIEGIVDQATPVEAPFYQVFSDFLTPEARRKPISFLHAARIIEDHLHRAWWPSLQEKSAVPEGSPMPEPSPESSSASGGATQSENRWTRKLHNFMDPRQWTPLNNPIVWAMVGAIALIPPMTPLGLITLPAALLVGYLLSSDKPQPSPAGNGAAPEFNGSTEQAGELDMPLKQTLTAFLRQTPNMREQTLGNYLTVLNDCAEDPKAPAIVKEVAHRLKGLRDALSALPEASVDPENRPVRTPSQSGSEQASPDNTLSDDEKGRFILDANYQHAVRQQNAPSKIAQFEQRLDALKRAGNITPQNEAVVRGWIEELHSGNPADPGMGMIEKTLTTFFRLPTRSVTPAKLSEAQASEILDRDHWDMKQPKDMVLRYLMKEQHLDALGVPKDKRRPEILCFVGPPGAGKSTLVRSLAEAMGRPMAKLSLGGVHKEDDIRGLQRYYMGAKAGGIVSELIRTGVDNPVFLLDEIDKMGESSHHGNPAAALLSVLDPDQNRHFNDHFLDGVDVDLSKVLFACTANDLEKIPGPLRDRMKIIPINGYLPNEKLTMLETHILPRARTRNGLDRETLQQKGLLDPSVSGEPFTLPQATREALIAEYGHGDGGVRGLDRLIDTIAQNVARHLRAVEGRPYVASDFPTIQPADLPQYLDQKYGHSTSRLDPAPKIGHVNVLYYQSGGGGGAMGYYVDVVPESSGKTGSTKTTRTGAQLLTLAESTGGMQGTNVDSAQIGFNFVQNHFDKIQRYWRESDDPAVQQAARLYDCKRLLVNTSKASPGSPMDGPSAGAIQAIALISALTGLPVPGDFAMTGTMDLRGNVGIIGGVREKITGSFQQGVQRYFIPRANAPHLVDVPESVKSAVSITPVDHITDVMAGLWGKDNPLVKAFREDPTLTPYQKPPKTGLRFPADDAPNAPAAA
ncbi:MAG: AAA family ATPase [Vampirovibrionales bacterium]|nr:AAA family ATPase [Vampirovibrionales bacterium]